MISKISKNPILILLFIYIFSRLIIFNLFQLKFESDWIYQMWHFVDIDLIKSKLLESVFYFHYQPPFFNLFLGLIYKQNIIDPSNLLLIIFYSLTFFIGLIIYKTNFEITKSLKLSLISSIIFYLFPQTILYENWPIYTWTSSFLICLSFFLLNSFFQNKNEKDLFLFFIAQLILILSRSAFHPIYFIGWFSMMIIFYSKYWKKITRSFLFPFLILLIVCFKNLYVFGFFGVGSGLGFSLYKITPKEINKVPVKNLIKINKEFEITPVRSIKTYGYDEKPIPESLRNIEILNREFKTTLGRFTEEFSVNLGHFHYLEIAKKYQESSLAIIKKYPSEYFKRVLRGIIMFFKPSWDHGFGLENNSPALKTYINITSLENLRYTLEKKIGVEKKPWPLSDKIALTSYFIIPIFYLIIFILLFKKYGIKEILNRPHFLFFIFTVFYLFSVSNLVELAENDRYRVMIDPVVYLMGTGLLFTRINRKNIHSN